MTHKTEEFSTLFPKKKGGQISSMLVIPDGLEFETQNVNEQIFIMLRRHIISNTSWIFYSLVFTFIPVVIPRLVQLFSDNINPDILKDSYVVVLLFIWYLLIFTYSTVRFLDWFFNVYVVTNERVLDFDFSPIAMHKISEANLENVEDATQETIGLLPSLFNYGDVYIQTAGQKREFDFNAVPNPSWVRDKIMDLKDLVVRGK